MRNEMSPLAVEDHPLWPKWKARLEEFAGCGTAQQAVARYNAALDAYNKISEEI
jgi:hypothetical protein